MWQWETCERGEVEETFGKKDRETARVRTHGPLMKTAKVGTLVPLKQTARVRTQEPSKKQCKGGEFRRSGRKSSGRKRRKIRRRR